MSASHPASARRLRALAGSILGFAVVSGLGLLIDLGLFLGLTRWGLEPGPANLASASAAVTFVYFVATRRVFDYAGRFLVPLFLVYLAYHGLAIALASAAVVLLAGPFGPLAAKLLVLPATFSANYVFMSFLTRSRP